MRVLILVCAIAMSCFRPSVPGDVCEIRCETALCPGRLSCGADGYCHASADEAMCQDAAPLPAICPPGFTNGYQVITATDRFADAELACEAMLQVPSSMHTHLVVFETAAELTVVTGMPNFPQMAWVGLTDRVIEGDYRWVTGIPPLPSTSPMWASPPDNAGNQDCGRIADTGAIPVGLDDESCSSNFAYVCECDAMPVNAGGF